MTQVRPVLSGSLDSIPSGNFPRRLGGVDASVLKDKKAWELSVEVFRALRNPRRRSILSELSLRPRLSVIEIQKTLRSYGSDHSLSTIQSWYLEPLLSAGLIREMGDDLELRLLGARIFEVLKQLDIQFQEKSLHCYEERVLLRLLKGPASYGEVSELILPERIARIVNRLEGLIAPVKGIVTYKATESSEPEEFEPADRIVPLKGQEVLRFIKERREAQLPVVCEGLDLAERTAYRYLAWLETQGLLENVTQPRQYALTDKGLQVAELMQRIVDEVMNYPLYVPSEYEAIQNKVVSYIDVMGRRGKPTSEINIWENLDLYFTWNFARLIRLDELDFVISRMEQERVLEKTYKGFYTLKKAPTKKVLPQIGKSKYVVGYAGGLQQRTPTSMNK